jgi:nitroreductase
MSECQVEFLVTHAVQNIALQAVALGLGSVCIGGYDDSEVRRVLMLPDEEVPLYIIPIGRKK